MSLQLLFSECEFGGFYDVSILLTEEKITANYDVSDSKKEAYEKKMALDKFMDNVTLGHYTETESFFIFGQGEITWAKLSTINYYEEINESYSFFFELIDQEKNKLTIRAKCSVSPKSNFLKNHSLENKFENVLDAHQSSFKKADIEKEYLKNTYNKIIEAIVPIATDKLFNQYLNQLKNEEKVKFGEIEIEQHGIYLKKKGWLFSKKMLVPWDVVGIKHEKTYCHIFDKRDPKTELNIAKRLFLNKTVFEKILAWGKG